MEVEASADATGTAGVGVALRNYPQMRQGAWVLASLHPASLEWGCIGVRQLPSPTSNSQVGAQLGALSSHTCLLGTECLPGSGRKNGATPLQLPQLGRKSAAWRAAKCDQVIFFFLYFPPHLLAILSS